MKKQKSNSANQGNKKLSSEELDKLKQQYKEGNLKFNSEEVAKAMIDEGVNLKD